MPGRKAESVWQAVVVGLSLVQVRGMEAVPVAVIVILGD